MVRTSVIGHVGVGAFVLLTQPAKGNQGRWGLGFGMPSFRQGGVVAARFRWAKGLVLDRGKSEGRLSVVWTPKGL